MKVEYQKEMYNQSELGLEMNEIHMNRNLFTGKNNPKNTRTCSSKPYKITGRARAYFYPIHSEAQECLMSFTYRTQNCWGG